MIGYPIFKAETLWDPKGSSLHGDPKKDPNTLYKIYNKKRV
jgi:hypothetical protein